MPERGLDDRELIFVVVDGKAAREAGTDLRQRIAIAPQQPHAEGVKRGDVRRRREILAFEQRGDARAHFVRGLVGERDRQDGGRRDAMAADEMRDAVRDDARLAASGAGQDQQRTFGVCDGFALLGV